MTRLRALKVYNILVVVVIVIYCNVPLAMSFLKKMDFKHEKMVLVK